MMHGEYNRPTITAGILAERLRREHYQRLSDVCHPLESNDVHVSVAHVPGLNCLRHAYGSSKSIDFQV